MNRTAVIVTLGLLAIGAFSSLDIPTGHAVASSYVCGEYARAVHHFVQHRYDAASDVNANGVLDSADLEQLYVDNRHDQCPPQDQCAHVGATYEFDGHTLACVRTPKNALVLRLISLE